METSKCPQKPPQFQRNHNLEDGGSRGAHLRALFMSHAVHLNKCTCIGRIQIKEAFYVSFKCYFLKLKIYSNIFVISVIDAFQSVSVLSVNISQDPLFGVSPEAGSVTGVQIEAPEVGAGV